MMNSETPAPAAKTDWQTAEVVDARTGQVLPSIPYLENDPVLPLRDDACDTPSN
jgi:hypothetical protein